jgi:hypothetical protein
MFIRNTQYSVCRFMRSESVLENKPELCEVLRNTSFAFKATLQCLQTSKQSLVSIVETNIVLFRVWYEMCVLTSFQLVVGKLLSVCVCVCVCVFFFVGVLASVRGECLGLEGTR